MVFSTHTQQGQFVLKYNYIRLSIDRVGDSKSIEYKRVHVIRTCSVHSVMPTQALIFDNSSECKDYSQCLLSISRDQNALHRSKIALSALLMLPYFKLTNRTAIMPIRTSLWLLITSLNVYIPHVQSRVSRAGQSSWRSCIMHIMWSKVYKA